MLHNVLFSGHQFEVPFDTTVASAWLSPSSALVREGACTEVTLTTGIELPGFSVEAYGLAKPEIWNDYPIPQDDPNDPSTASFTQTLTVDETDIQLSVDVTGADDADLDLFVVRDINEDGQFTTQEVVASSTTSTANESVRIWKPVTGTYQVWVQGWQVPGDTTPANIKIELLGGDRVYVESDGGDIVPDEPNVFRVCLREGDPVEPDEEGLLIMGPEAAPGLFQVQVHTIASSIYLPISKRESMDEPAQP
jgi:hypothetical protein